MSRFKRIAPLAILASLALTAPAHAAVVVSQVYGGGGNTGATYKNDFIELFNDGAAPVDLSTYAVQYSSATAGAFQTTPLSGTVGAGRYFLVQEAQGANGTTNLPAPDATGTLALSGTSGKVALTSSPTALTCTAGCAAQPSVVDFVGYGAANDAEGTPAPILSNTTAALRASNGCIDANDNSTDFAAGAPSPRNAATAANSCAGVNKPPAVATGGDLNLASATGGTRTVTARDPDGRVTSLALVAPPAGVSIGATTPAANPGDQASAVVSVDSSVPDGSSTIQVRATNADATPQGTTGRFRLRVGVTPIDQVQGSGVASPLTGQTVTVRGVVTGIDDQIGASYSTLYPLEAGVFIQTPDGQGDTDPATSEGIFVEGVVGKSASSGGRREIPLGSTVTVTGRVAEPFNQTVLVADANTRVSPSSTTAALPAAIDVDPALANAQTVSSNGTGSYYEKYEGMRLRLGVGVARSGGTNKFNELALVPGENPTPTRLFRDDPAPGLLLADPQAGSDNPPNPNYLPHSDTEVDADLFDTVRDLVGPVTFNFNTYRITPQIGTPPIVQGTGLAFPPVTPDQPTDTLRMASYNVENFFPPGATNDLQTISQAQYEAQRDQIAAAINSYLKRPDVIGMQEIAYFPDKLNQLADLASRLGGYTAYIEQGNDTRGITVGFLVKEGVTVNSVAQLGKAETIPDMGCGDASSGGGREALFGRPPLAVDVTKGATRLTLISNHWASQSHSEACRNAQADFVRQQVAALEAQGKQVAVSGDLNDFEDSDALTNHLVGAGTTLANQWSKAPATNRYSFSFKNRLQTLDHIFLTSGLASDVTDMRYVHFDNDYYERHDAAGNPTGGTGESDHDPPLVTLRVTPVAGTGGGAASAGGGGGGGSTESPGTVTAPSSGGPGSPGASGSPTGSGKPAGSPKPSAHLGATLAVKAGPVRRAGGLLLVTLRNGNAFTVSGTLSARLHGKVLLVAKYKVTSHQTRTVRAPIARTARARLARAGTKAKIVLTLTGKAATGRERTSTTSVRASR